MFVVERSNNIMENKDFLLIARSNNFKKRARFLITFKLHTNPVTDKI